MLRWLKRRLRKWLGIEPETVSSVFEAVVDGEIMKVAALRVIGLHLVCHLRRYPDDTSAISVRLIGEGQACDREQFQRLWRKMGGKSLDLVWSDGTPYNSDT